MKDKKIYKKIIDVEMANHNDIYQLTFETISKDFIKGLNKYNKEDFKEACSDFEIPLSKKECLKLSCKATVSGYGTHVSKKLWQLPKKIKEEVSKMLCTVKIEVKLN